MANLRSLVKRRKAVRNIRKITKTMELIATARFKKAFDRASEAAAYTKKIAELAADLSQNAGEVSHPLLATRPVKKSLLLVLTSNRGLCGGYNGSILREANGEIRRLTAAAAPFDLEVSGKRGQAFFKFQRVPRSREYSHFEDKPTFEQVDAVAGRYIDLFITGQIDEVKVAYMRFVSAARQEAVVETLLPLGSVGATTSAGAGPRVEYEFIPSAAEILGELVPAAFKARLFKCFLDAAVSEQIARRVAMKAATENAGDLIKDITRLYNRTRQANITKEISELIAGSEALK
ncbi:ATP synthase F1 subunit gamma [Urbifossiella limnaea]|uniref:ATP synthase gamma chain n=1 Tax=Urbifossiella limnaea TaxID=2528023 RepID=A0A517Y2S8_9BACT|nr:ATP synthase F1 subunit gamma [Urbifossiella limnaea]QDU24004.1 ATP synthase gamma chain [Urbifossiella limnaea]